MMPMTAAVAAAHRQNVFSVMQMRKMEFEEKFRAM